ncbi:alpha/beta hydrolase [Lacinutrix sp. Bg11-31]|uniref:alpha/beta hydrolase n=1 Tax=Lacinutrix sp. Bg11-31 TaxID=2057808 RepID=UPI000C31516C|nr:alpha/beta hydrolase [Lacinutrix sp. Bg11-31]AUC80845.1 alpha/beta hydrolase [Lacinutrix sp. Bg11-31]
MKIKFLIVLLFVGSLSSAQEKNYTAQEIAINKLIDGTLLLPNGIEKPNLVIIIAGSGPTDRDGNQNFLKGNSLKKLAQGLSAKNIATFRYDKRIVKQIRKGNVDKDMMFDDFVVDAKSVLTYFKDTKNYNKIYIAGHSQGSMVGMLAAKGNADGFISLAGAGQSIDKVIIEQVEKTAPMFLEDTKRVFKVLQGGKTTSDFPPALASIFNIDVQPFIANWMSYNPQVEIKKLNMPILIINGTKDLQVSEAEAKLLKEAAPKAEIIIIAKMNHILVPIEGDNLENSKSYNETARKLAPELLEAIVEFVK